MCRFCMYAYLFDAFNYIFGEGFCSIYQTLKGVLGINIFKNTFFRQNTMLLSSLHSPGFLSQEVATPHIAVSTVTSFSHSAKRDRTLQPTAFRFHCPERQHFPK
jgi:hypothetical protein